MWSRESVAYLVNILCMSLSAEEQHSQTVLDTPEDGERGWEYWEAQTGSAELTRLKRLQPVFVYSGRFRKVYEMNLQ